MAPIPWISGTLVHLSLYDWVQETWSRERADAEGPWRQSGMIESHVEEATLAWLSELGWDVAYGPDVEPEKLAAERDDFSEVVLSRRLRAALERINPQLPGSAIDDALKKVLVADSPSLIENNHRFHRLLVDGIDVEYARPDGSIAGDKAWLVDFDDVDANHWLAVNQFTVVEGKFKKRPDVVVFVNGLPLAVIELKNPADVNATTRKAFQQLQTYKHVIPSLFTCNELLVASDGLDARHGTLTAPWERFMPWRTVDGTQVAPKGAPELPTLVRGVFEKRRFLDLVLGLEDGKRRFVEAVTALGKAFSLAVPHEDALRIRDEVAYFQTVRAALMKTEVGRGASDEELDLAVRQIVSKAVSTDEVVDVFKVAGLEHPDISVLDDKFLAEVRDMPRRNLAVELLEKLLRDEVTCASAATSSSRGASPRCSSTRSSSTRTVPSPRPRSSRS